MDKIDASLEILEKFLRAVERVEENEAQRPELLKKIVVANEEVKVSAELLKAAAFGTVKEFRAAADSHSKNLDRLRSLEYAERRACNIIARSRVAARLLSNELRRIGLIQFDVSYGDAKALLKEREVIKEESFMFTPEYAEFEKEEADECNI